MNLKDTAYAFLKDRLVRCVYVPGSVLNEASLAAELGISRTPVRDAISLLESEGYVRIVPKKGIFVTDVLLSDVLQIFQVRMEVEPVALRLAGPNLSVEELMLWRTRFQTETTDFDERLRLDTGMHLFLIDHCRNTYIIEMMRRVYDKNMRVVLSSRNNQAHAEAAKEEHIGILNALIDQDLEAACRLMRTHLSNCRRAAVDFYYQT